MNTLLDKIHKPMAALLAPLITCLALAGASCLGDGVGPLGADTPWTTYEAEAMKTNGIILGPRYAAHLVETEASGEKCVKLTEVGGFVEFAAGADANALVVRYCLPDSPQGGGVDSSLALLINGREVQTLALSSRYSRIYGVYPFTNNPADGKDRNFYDEFRVKGLQITRGDVIRLQKNTADGRYCIVDLVDLEMVPAPLAPPANALSLLDFGADGKGETDDTAALCACVAKAEKTGGVVWVPAGRYQLTGDIELSSAVTIQGAGMWYTTFVGDPARYGSPDHRVRFRLAGKGIHLADFAILGRLDHRIDNEENDGLLGIGCAECTVERLWIEHTKVGIWIYNGANLRIAGCRFRDLLADGVNLCAATYGTVIENCSARGSGDDCFAIWPAAFSQGYEAGRSVAGNNVIRRCTGQLPFLANGGAIYGGASNRIEDCLFTDISTGCGVLLSTTFSTANEKRKIDNNFSGTTVVRHCALVRCGGDDHAWSWRGALQLCVDLKSIAGVLVSQVDIRDSLSDGLSVVAPGSPKVGATLLDVRLDQVNISNSSIGTPSHHDLWIRADAVGGLTLANSTVTKIQNDSDHFKIVRE